VKTGSTALSAVQVNYAFDKDLADVEQALDRYRTLTGWSEALLHAGAGRVAVVQRFHRDVHVSRNRVDYFFRAGSAWRLAGAVSRLEPDIAHVNGLIFPAATWLLRRALPSTSSIVAQNHSDGGPVGRSPRLRLAGRATRGAVDAFLFAATEHAVPWRRAGLIGRHQPTYDVMEASTGLKPVERAQARTETGISGSPAVLWVGRLNANKDPLTVVDGFEHLVGRFPDATLAMIYGADDLLAALRARIAQSEALRSRVRLVGAVAHEAIASFFSAADLFVLGSHHEGSGYSLMEACACGAVPVVTRIPTFRLLTGGLGALWTPGDAHDCARALVDVASRDLDAERARLAAHFADALSWDAVGRRALEIYRKVSAGR
jgi:glycosyltransferase involved in cell wall biosynthesis